MEPREVAPLSDQEAPVKEPCPHENQYVNDRCLFVCKDCDEELGR